MKITAARITSMPEKLFDSLPEVFVTINGKEQSLFTYYPDEISFKASDFIGLTLDEALHLKFTRDREFLRS